MPLCTKALLIIILYTFLQIIYVDKASILIRHRIIYTCLFAVSLRNTIALSKHNYMYNANNYCAIYQIMSWSFIMKIFLCLLDNINVCILVHITRNKHNKIKQSLTFVSFHVISRVWCLRMPGCLLTCSMANSTAGSTPRPTVPTDSGKRPARCKTGRPPRCPLPGLRPNVP